MSMNVAVWRHHSAFCVLANLIVLNNNNKQLFFPLKIAAKPVLVRRKLPEEHMHEGVCVCVWVSRVKGG